MDRDPRDEHLLQVADKLIDNLLEHQGAEGFSESTWELVREYEKLLNRC